MNAISPTSQVTAIAPASAPAASTSQDALALMRPSMDAAFTIGRPTDAAGAAGILAAGATYVQGAAATVSKLDEGIEQRMKLIQRLQQTDPQAAKEQQAQLDLLQKLRDRIQLSIDRVSDTLAGRDHVDAPSSGADAKDDGEARRRIEELELLEERRRLLAPPTIGAAGGVPAAAVASSYAAGTTGGQATAAIA